jgi:linoleoyl-CoA desaturase
LKFRTPDSFRQALRRRVEEYFVSTGRKPRDCPQMYAKSAIILSVCIMAYVVLVALAGVWWLAIPLAVLLGLALAAAAFNIQHDGGHGAYSDRRWVNRLAALTLDLLGGSSYVWARKHNSIHHSYTNVSGHDDDINVGLLGRLSPQQQRLKFHRFQHVYLWFLYGFLPMKWHLFDDFRDVLTGRIGGHRFPRPRGWDLVIFIGGKALFFSLAFGLPMLLNPWWCVLALYGIATFVQGVTLSVVFQMAHCVEEAEFPQPCPETGRIECTWAVHQVQTTVDFAPRNRLLTWFVGGLNFQIEHHLFPQICHVHYPALAKLVQETCREFALKYRACKSLAAGVTSHYRWLRRMGRPVGAS